MKFKKTIYNWLTNRFLLIIRDEENFAEKRTFGFTPAKVIVFSFVSLVSVFSLCFYLSRTIQLTVLNPEYAQLEVNKKIIYLSSQLDSLSNEVELRDNYLQNYKKVLAGEVTPGKGQPVQKEEGEKMAPVVDKLTPVDMALREEVEKNVNPFPALSSKRFVNPAVGKTEKIEGQSGQKTLKINLVGDVVVKAVTKGTIIYSGQSQGGNYLMLIQHSDNMISSYEAKMKPVKRQGMTVQAGEAIAQSLSQGGKESEKFLYFELWEKGVPADPVKYLSF